MRMKEKMFSRALVLAMLFLVSIPLSAQIFVEEAIERGIDATIASLGLGGSGVSTIDFDQDGDDDITLGDNLGVRFYENNNGVFELIDVDIETPPGDLRGVVWSDINNDGHFDLLLSSYLGEVRFYKNLGNMVFEDITESSGIANVNTGNWGVSFADINRDGFVDLQLCRYVGWLDIPEDPSVDQLLWTRLYLNNGDDTFTDFTIDSGFIIEPAPVFQGVFLDINNDLWPDNFSIIDRDPGNRMFINNEGVFEDVTDEYGVSYPFNDIMSNSIADYDNDGDLDIFMTNNGGFVTPSYLLENNNNGESFTEVAADVGVQTFDFCWGAVWIDADNDGWQDLFFGNRFSSQNYFYINNGGNFTLAQDEMLLDEEVPSFSAAKGDFDNDGFSDLMVNSRSPDRSILLMNQGGDNHYIKLTPHGTLSNSMATGSWIRVYADSDTYVHFTLCGEGYISQNSQHLNFGLGEETTEVDSVEIWYPSGHMDTYYNLPADSSYHFYEGETFQVEITSDVFGICDGEEMTLDAGDFDTIEWSSGETTRYLTVNETGLYSVTVSNEFGITATDTFEVEVQPIPIISVSITPNPCLGDSLAVISLEDILGIETESVVWDNGMTGSTIDSLQAGTYSYDYLSVSGCSTSGSVEIIDPSELVLLSTMTPADEGQANGSITLLIFGGAAPYTVGLDGETVSTTIDNLEAGTYPLVVTDSNGCSETIEVTVESTLSVSEIEKDKFSVSPNPASNTIEVKSTAFLDQLLIYNATGTLQKEFKSPTNIIDISELASGIYVIIAISDGGILGHSRLVKE